MKKNSYKHFDVASYENLAHDEKAIYKNACDCWLKKNPDDQEGATLCACGAVIIYRSLLQPMDSDDEAHEEQSEDEFVRSCMDVTAWSGTKYVAYYRESCRRHSEQYSVIYAGTMLFKDDSDIANECARCVECGETKHNFSDRRSEWKLSGIPEDILANCLLAGEGELEPEDFSPSVCEGCERDDCDWHPDAASRR